MIWDWVEGDALICDERRDLVPVSWPQVVSAAGVGSPLEVGTWYVADCEGHVPLRAHLPYISGASMETGILAPASLKDGDNSLVVAEQVEDLVRKLWGPQLDGQCSIESLEVADEGVVPEYPRREGNVIGSACCEGSTARHASVDVELYRVPVILVNEESAIGGGEEPIKPG